jgi:amino acid transporter
MQSARGSSYKRLRLLQLAAVIFLTVSGGPYGLEPLLSYAGNNGALLLLMITPVFWDIPIIFTVLELNSMMPVTGGYYQWVKRALGMRWAFYEGWWTWLYTFSDLAIYPVLFMQYAEYFFPGIGAFKIPICLLIIWLSVGINVRGIVPVGKVSIILSALVLLPFLILFGKFFFLHGVTLGFPLLSLKGTSFSALGMALYTIMWNYIGWDNVTTYAEEVNKPIRTYLVSTGIAFFSIYLIYILAIYTAQQSGINADFLSAHGFPFLGELVGGRWLAQLLALGGMASTLGIFSAVLLSVSRVPEVMANDRLLPAKLNSLHPRFNTPYFSIIICGIIVSGMILWTFTDLIIIDVTLYGMGLLLEFISLIVLRIKEPNEPRPFSIPLNVAGLCVMILLPFGIFGIALSGAITSNSKTIVPVLFSLAALFSTEIVWQFIRVRTMRKKND